MQRLPDHLKRPIMDTEQTKIVRKILKAKCLNTVCESARCPNKSECYAHNTATFLIMGNICTRNCRYCNISVAKPNPLDLDEPKRVAEAVAELGLKYTVITSVTRDDIQDGGAVHFANCINEIRKCNKDVKIEILTPDFKNNKEALDTILLAEPNVFNHNIETVKRLFPIVRPQGNYQNSIKVLKYIKEKSDITIKSGLMVGLGESFDEIEDTLNDLRTVGVDIVTIGQYIQPSKKHIGVAKYYTLEEFETIKLLCKKTGMDNYQVGPLVRSSYHAAISFDEISSIVSV